MAFSLWVPLSPRRKGNPRQPRFDKMELERANTATKLAAAATAQAIIEADRMTADLTAAEPAEAERAGGGGNSV